MIDRTGIYTSQYPLSVLKTNPYASELALGADSPESTALLCATGKNVVQTMGLALGSMGDLIRLRIKYEDPVKLGNRQVYVTGLQIDPKAELHTRRAIVAKLNQLAGEEFLPAPDDTAAPIEISSAQITTIMTQLRRQAHATRENGAAHRANGLG